MKPPELDWRLDDAPPEGEAEPRSAGPPPAVPRRPVWRRALPWLAVLLVLALGAYGYQRLGWQRLRGQVDREIEYEDERARAGDVMAVLGLQAVDDSAWRHLRSAEAGLGLAAPLPAPHLAPAAEPPHLLRLDTAGGEVFTATVRRAYRDAAGGAYAFDLAQRYRNLGPGLWQRLPPLPLAIAEGWAGERLSAEALPAEERDLWLALLPEVDARLSAVCVEWGCRPSAVLQLEVTSWPAAPPVIGPPAWATDEQAIPYPAAFDVVTALPNMPNSGPLRLPAFALTGLPAGPAEQAALTDALTMQLLYAVAARHTLISGPAGNPFLVALIARAETRLGLTVAAPALPSPNSLLTPGWLWQARDLRRTSDPRPESAYSQEGRALALAFLDHALRGQPAEADGHLVRTLLRQQTLLNWLSGALGAEAAEAALAGWADTVTAAYARQLNLPPPDAAGLFYACDDVLRQATAAGPRRLVDSPDLGSGFGPLAASGHYAAYTRFTGTGRMELVLVDTVGPAAQVIAEADQLSLMGWSAAGQLLYLQREGEEPETLMRYDPRADTHTPLFGSVSAGFLSFFPSWSADRRRLGLNLVLESAASDFGSAPVVANVVDPVRLETLADTGQGTWVSPDGTAAAFVIVDQAPPDERPSAITLVITALGQRGQAAQTVALATHPLTNTQSGLLGLTVWSPDSQQVVYAAGDPEGEAQVFVLARAGGAPQALALGSGAEAHLPIAFSADGQFLALVSLSNEGVREVLVLAWPAGPVRHYAPADGLSGLTWSTSGHTLVLPTTGGIYLTDPATGAAGWVALGQCGGVGW